MNKSIVTYNRFLLHSESHSITTEDHADILHGYIVQDILPQKTKGF